MKLSNQNKWISIFLRCLADCCNTILLQSSQNVFLTTKLPRTLHHHGLWGDTDWIFIVLGVNLSFKIKKKRQKKLWQKKDTLASELAHVWLAAHWESSLCRMWSTCNLPDYSNQGKNIIMPLTMSPDSKRLILFLLSSVFYTSLSSSYALFSSFLLLLLLWLTSPFPPFSAHHTHLSRHRSPLDIFNYEIPSINVNLDSLIDEFSGAPCRRSVAVTDSPEGDAVPEEEPQSTTLWPMTLRHHSLPAPLWLFITL